ncbi:hypothetical protein [Proteiniphilum sp. UBA5384]|nr:hypothetical protein [Proteiniphilum sp. UBA5384]
MVQDTFFNVWKNRKKSRSPLLLGIC